MRSGLVLNSVTHSDLLIVQPTLSSNLNDNAIISLTWSQTLQVGSDMPRTFTRRLASPGIGNFVHGGGPLRRGVSHVWDLDPSVLLRPGSLKGWRAKGAVPLIRCVRRRSTEECVTVVSLRGN